MKTEHFTRVKICYAPVSTLKNLEVTPVVFVLLMSFFSTLYIPQKQKTQTCYVTSCCISGLSKDISCVLNSPEELYFQL